MYENSQVIKEGHFLYDGTVPCDIRIFKHNMSYGSGDYEDEPQFRDDLEGEFYYVEYGSIVERGRFVSRSAALLSLDDAIREAEKATDGTLKWQD